MRSRFGFSWDITLLLVIVCFLYVCFDKIIALIAILAVSRDHTNIDMIPLLKDLASMNGDFAKSMVSLVGTFFTIVLAGSLFKGQSEQQLTDNTKEKRGTVISAPSSLDNDNNNGNKVFQQLSNSTTASSSPLLPDETGKESSEGGGSRGGSGETVVQGSPSIKPIPVEKPLITKIRD